VGDFRFIAFLFSHSRAAHSNYSFVHCCQMLFHFYFAGGLEILCAFRILRRRGRLGSGLLYVTSLMMVFNRNRSKVTAFKCGPSAMLSSPMSSSSSRYHGVNKKEVSRTYTYLLLYQ